MKNSRNEKLHEFLAEIDKDLLDTAYKIDDAEKLRAYTERENAGKRKKTIITKTMVLKTVAAAACICFALNIVSSLPGLFESEYPKYTTPPVVTVPGDDDDFVIEDISMLNYYSALRIFGGGAEVWHTAAGAEEFTPVLLSAEAEKSKIIYYKLDPTRGFSVSSAEYFCIDVTDENGFLASKVGTGPVDVVITENNIDPMITFKNGDRYFSCLWTALSKKEKTFSTHKYIEGFNLVKNLEQENCAFRITYDENGQVTGFLCYPFQAGVTNADGELAILSKTSISNDRHSFTISELERYFSNSYSEKAVSAKVLPSEI